MPARWAPLYTSKLPITAVHLLNEDVLPAGDAADIRIETVLSDKGREFCIRTINQHLRRMKSALT